MTRRNPDRRGILVGAMAATVLFGARAASEAKPLPRSHGESTMKRVPFATTEPVGTIIISNEERKLWRVLSSGQAEEYRVSIGRPGFAWTGTTIIRRKEEWPGWRPPSDMRERDPNLPEYVPPGPYNPLGARALYLYANGRDTLYRIHGTNSLGTVGNYETSGCFRLTNRDVMDLYPKVLKGTKVVVF